MFSFSFSLLWSELGRICHDNLQNFPDHRVAPWGAVHVRFMTVKKKKDIDRPPYFSTRRRPTGGDTRDHSH